MSDREQMKKPPVPPPLPRRPPQDPPAAEPHISSISPIQQALLRKILPYLNVPRFAVSVSAGKIVAAGNVVGELHDDKLLIERTVLNVRPPALMENMAKAQGLKIYLEVTDTETTLCAGKTLGQKLLFLTL